MIIWVDAIMQLKTMKMQSNVIKSSQSFHGKTVMFKKNLEHMSNLVFSIIIWETQKDLNTIMRDA